MATKKSSMTIGNTANTDAPAHSAESEAERAHLRDLAHESGPIPEGRLFRVQAHDVTGVLIETTGDFATGGEMTHQEAVNKCLDLNGRAAAASASFWFGVTHVPVDGS